jgi:hypothetical protein
MLVVAKATRRCRHARANFHAQDACATWHGRLAHVQSCASLIFNEFDDATPQLTPRDPNSEALFDSRSSSSQTSRAGCPCYALPTLMPTPNHGQSFKPADTGLVST